MTQVIQAVALKLDETQGTMCTASEEMMNKFDEYNVSDARNDEDTVIFSTDFSGPRRRDPHPGLETRQKARNYDSGDYIKICEC